MTKMLPLYADLIFGGLYIFTFTGTWLIVNDIRRLLSKDMPVQEKQRLQFLHTKIRFRRVVCLIVGIVFVVLYALGKNIPVIAAIVFGVCLLDSMQLAGRSRKYIESLYRQRE